MRIRVLLPLLSGVVIGIAVGLMQSQGANAACGFINGVWSHELAMTPGCVAENNATAAADKAAREAKEIQDQKDVEARAKENADRDYIANGSRPCSLYPASITPSCVADNLQYEKNRSIEMAEKAIQDQKDVETRAKEQAELDYIRNGSRPCSIFPASITPACEAENMSWEKTRAATEKVAMEQRATDAEVKARQLAKEDYIRNGSRPCSLFPASITAECASENLLYEKNKTIEMAALSAISEVSKDKTLITQADNGSLLVVAKISSKVDLLTTVVKLLNSKGKVVDTGVIRYKASGEPYFVFDNFTSKGNYRVQLSLPKKKFSTIAIKVT